jgi:hypothetical protein
MNNYFLIFLLFIFILGFYLLVNNGKLMDIRCQTEDMGKIPYGINNFVPAIDCYNLDFSLGVRIENNGTGIFKHVLCGENISPSSKCDPSTEYLYYYDINYDHTFFDQGRIEHSVRFIMLHIARFEILVFVVVMSFPVMIFIRITQLYEEYFKHMSLSCCSKTKYVLINGWNINTFAEDGEEDGEEICLIEKQTVMSDQSDDEV